LLIWILISQFLLAQDSSKTEPAGQSDSEKEVRKLLDIIADDLAQKGPLAWLKHFSTDETFFMASDGKVVFPDYQTAKTFLEDFAPKVAKMKINWSNVRVQMIERNTALVGAAYDEVIAEKSGEEKKIGGYFSGIAVRQAGGWKLRHLHWSSPSADPNQ
jgi:hypothetical protein